MENNFQGQSHEKTWESGVFFLMRRHGNQVFFLSIGDYVLQPEVGVPLMSSANR